MDELGKVGDQWISGPVGQWVSGLVKEMEIYQNTNESFDCRELEGSSSSLDGK